MDTLEDVVDEVAMLMLHCGAVQSANGAMRSGVQIMTRFDVQPVMVTGYISSCFAAILSCLRYPGLGWRAVSLRASIVHDG